MGELIKAFTFGRNALKRSISESADSAIRSIRMARRGLDLVTLKAEDNGTYNIVRDLISFTGILERRDDSCVITSVGEAFERLYVQNPEDAWRWLITRSLWLYTVPNGTNSNVNAVAKGLNASFDFFRRIVGLLVHLSAQSGAGRFLTYEEVCILFADDKTWGMEPVDLFAGLLAKRSAPDHPRGADRSFLADLETEYGIPRDNFAALFGKAFGQTGLFEYGKSGAKSTSIALSNNLDRVLQGRIRFIIDHPVSWNGADWSTFLQQLKDDLPEEVSLAPAEELEEEVADEPIGPLVETATNDLVAANLQVEHELVLRFAAALLTKRFVILTGLSGSGKTKLAQAFAAWLCPRHATRQLLKTGSTIPGPRAEYRVLTSDSLSVEIESPEGTRVTLPYGLIDEWADTIVTSGFDRQTPEDTILDAVAKATRYSSQFSSFKSELKAAAFARLDVLPDSSAVRRYEIVSVAADWTSKESSFGYVDALNSSRYVRATPIVNLILRAKNDPDVPYFLILDEMNLSHVERYFADFLSALESGEPMSLHGFASDVDGVPPGLELPPNFFVVGTVNVDETTYMFSPKVLDRANTLEFRVGSAELKAFLGAPASVDTRKLEGAGRRFGKSFILEAANVAETLPEKHRVGAELELLFEVLSTSGSEFGFRTAKEFLRFIYFYSRLRGSDWSMDAAIDAQIVQKILPKLNGSRRQLEPILCSLAVLCNLTRDWDETGGIKNREFLVNTAGRAATLEDEALHPLREGNRFSTKPLYPLSYDKILRMLKRVTSEGFASFAEA